MKNSRFLLDEIWLIRYLGLNKHGLNVYRRLKMGEVVDSQGVGRKGVITATVELRIYTC
jgi:hypothetical protein